MSFKRFDPEDFLISGDSIVGPCWSTDSAVVPTLTVLNSGVSANYYKTGGNSSIPQLSYALGIKNSLIEERDVTYRQFANIVLGDADGTFNFGGTSSTTCSFFTVERARFKGSIFPGSFRASGSTSDDADAYLPATLDLVSNAEYVNAVSFNNAGRVFDLIPSGNTDSSTVHGLLLPDIGTFIFNGAPSGSGLPSSANGILEDVVVTKMKHLTINSEEALTSAYCFIRARNSEFNYSQNPSFIDTGSGGVRYTDFINSPQTFITTVGLYNDNNDLLATAKLSKPLKKDFTKEALIRVKLDF